MSSEKELLLGPIQDLIEDSTLELALHQKRRLTRIVCHYSVTCHWENANVQARVLDMGLGGIRLSVPQPLPVGMSVLVQLDPPLVGAFPVRAKVQWSDGLEAGVAYGDIPGNIERSWVQRVLKLIGLDEQAIFERRLHVRVASRLAVQVNGQDATMLNLGLRGALLEQDHEVEAGHRLELTMGPLGQHPPLTLEGEVVRCRARAKGVFYWGMVFFEPGPEPARLLEGYVLGLLRGPA